MSDNVRRLPGLTEHRPPQEPNRSPINRKRALLAGGVSLAAVFALPLFGAIDRATTPKTPRIIACGFAAVSPELPDGPMALGDAALADAEKNGVTAHKRNNLTEEIVKELGRSDLYNGDRIVIEVQGNQDGGHYVEGSVKAVGSDINSCPDFFAQPSAVPAAS